MKATYVYRVAVGFNWGPDDRRYEVGEEISEGDFPPDVWANILQAGLVVKIRRPPDVAGASGQDTLAEG